MAGLGRSRGLLAAAAAATAAAHPGSVVGGMKEAPVGRATETDNGKSPISHPTTPDVQEETDSALCKKFGRLNVVPQTQKMDRKDGKL